MALPLHYPNQICEQCGNGVLETGETCDDYNPQVGDGCESCAKTVNFNCVQDVLAKSICKQCGDGQLDLP